jgi:hypothetical protein
MEDGKTKMYDFEKCVRCRRISASWFGRTFLDICKRVREKIGFQKDFNEAGRHADELVEGKEIDWDHDSGFYVVEACGARTEVIVWFLSTPEFHKMFKLTPAQLSVATVKWFDEHGHEMKGVFLRPSVTVKPDVVRRVIFFYEKKWKAEDLKIDPKKRIREAQIVEAFATMTNDEVKARPKEPLSLCALSSQIQIVFGLRPPRIAVMCLRRGPLADFEWLV